MAKARRRFTEEFKREAIRLAARLGNLSAAARDLGISAQQLREWRDARAGEGVVASGSIPWEQEKAQLKRENRVLREEREILKKVLAILSEEPR